MTEVFKEEDVRTQTGTEVKTQGEDSHVQSQGEKEATEETNSTDTLTSDYMLPEPWENTFLLFRSPSLCSLQWRSQHTNTPSQHTCLTDEEMKAQRDHLTRQLLAERLETQAE